MSKDKSNLYLHAKKELELLGMYDKNEENEDGMQPVLADNIREMIDVWGKIGHSGGSAMWTRDILHRLLNWESLTPLTDDPDEWVDISDMQSGKPGWQNKRHSVCFSEDGGKTYYNIDEKKRKIHKSMPKRHLRQHER